MATKTPNPPVQHVDKLGVPIELDCVVAYPSGNTLDIGRVTKINNKMIKVSGVGSTRASEKNKYPFATVVLDSQAVTLWLLKRS
jgi:hypothetical protein